MGFAMNEPTIICPNCKSEIKLTESLAAPLIEATRLQFEHATAEKEAEIAKRERSMSKRGNRKGKRYDRRTDLAETQGCTGKDNC
jgi:hypothetical protein